MYPHPNRFSPLPNSWLLLPPSLWQLFWKHWHTFLFHYDPYEHKRLIHIRNVTPQTIFTILLPASFRSPADFTFHLIKHQLSVLPIKTSWDRILVTLSHLEKVTVTSSSGAPSVTWTSISPTSPCLPSPLSPLTVGKTSFSNHGSNFHPATSKLTFSTNYPEEIIWGKMVIQRSGTSTPTRRKECSHCPSSCFLLFYVSHLLEDQDYDFPWVALHNKISAMTGFG